MQNMFGETEVDILVVVVAVVIVVDEQSSLGLPLACSALGLAGSRGSSSRVCIYTDTYGGVPFVPYTENIQRWA